MLLNERKRAKRLKELAKEKLKYVLT